jgi:hypothetical protein
MSRKALWATFAVVQVVGLLLAEHSSPQINLLEFLLGRLLLVPGSWVLGLVLQGQPRGNDFVLVFILIGLPVNLIAWYLLSLVIAKSHKAAS